MWYTPTNHAITHSFFKSFRYIFLIIFLSCSIAFFCLQVMLECILLLLLLLIAWGLFYSFKIKITSFGRCFFTIVYKSMNRILVDKFIHNSFWKIMCRIFEYKFLFIADVSLKATGCAFFHWLPLQYKRCHSQLYSKPHFRTQ